MTRIAAVVALGLAACLQSPPGGSDAAPPAPADAAGPDATRCILLDESFDDPALDGEIWQSLPDPGGTIGVTDGHMVVEADPDAGSSYVEVLTRQSRPLADLLVTADLAVSWDGAGDAGLVVAGASGWIGFFFDRGVIAVARDLDGVYEVFCPAGDCTLYQAADHRYWQLREQAGLLYFDISSDGSIFTELAGPQSTPPGEFAITLWASADAGARVTSAVEHLVAGCGN